MVRVSSSLEQNLEFDWETLINDFLIKQITDLPLTALKMVRQCSTGLVERSGKQKKQQVKTEFQIESRNYNRIGIIGEENVRREDMEDSVTLTKLQFHITTKYAINSSKFNQFNSKSDESNRNETNSIN